MISLSRVVKVYFTASCEQRVIRPEPILVEPSPGDKRETGDDHLELEKSREEIRKEMEGLLMQARQEADSIMEQAKVTRENLLRDAKEQIAQLEQEAQQRGYQEGYRAGHEAARNEYAAHLAQARDFICSALDERKKILNESEPMIVDLVVSVAEKVLHQALQQDRTLLLSIVKVALQEIQTAKRAEIRVHPDDYIWVKEEQDQLIQSCVKPMELVVVSDSNIGSGGCVIYTESGSVDAKLDTQLHALKHALREAAGAFKHDDEHGEQMGRIQQSDQTDSNHAP